MTKARVFSLVIPCYNEEKAIPSFLTELNAFTSEFAQNFPETNLHITFVNNNSKDSSESLLQVYCQKKNKESLTQVFLINEFIQGYGSSLKAGFKSQSADHYAFLDLDNTYPLQKFILMYRLMLSQSELHMLMTDRFSATSQMPKLRFLGNHVFAMLVRFLFFTQISDACSGQRILSFPVIDQVQNLSENGLNFSIQLTCHALKNKWNTKVVPIQYNARTGESKLSIVKDGFMFLKIVLQTKFF